MGGAPRPEKCLSRHPRPQKRADPRTATPRRPPVCPRRWMNSSRRCLPKATRCWGRRQRAPLSGGAQSRRRRGLPRIAQPPAWPAHVSTRPSRGLPCARPTHPNLNTYTYVDTCAHVLGEDARGRASHCPDGTGMRRAPCDHGSSPLTASAIPSPASQLVQTVDAELLSTCLTFSGP